MGSPSPSPSPIDMNSIHLGIPEPFSGTSSIYRSPAKSKHSSHLRINVPESVSRSSYNNSDDESDGLQDTYTSQAEPASASDSALASTSASALGAPIEFSQSPSSIFERITHLPTPVISNGSFHSTFNTLDVAKTRLSPKHHDNTLPSPPRVISDYKPVPALGRKNSLLENKPSKRFVTNPVGIPPKSTPLSPVSSKSEHKVSKYLHETFYSTKLGKTFVFVDEIGHGTFSTVVLAKEIDPADSALIAIKIISIPIDDINEISNYKSYIKRELNILHQVHHPCVIQVLDYQINLAISREEIESPELFDDVEPSQDSHSVNNVDYLNLQKNSDQLIMVNYCPGGNLFQFLSKFNNSLASTELYYWKIIRRMVGEMVTTVAHLHTLNIVHRDIKLENILLNASLDQLGQLVKSHDPLITLTDFGLSKKLKNPHELLATRCGSQDYIPPELLMGLKYDGKLSDSWSVGVVIYSILEDRLPFDLPPIAMLEAAGISPSVIKRKASKQNTAHRIAMIDWDWYKVNGMLQTEDEELRTIISQLKELVDVLLVRKNNRKSVFEIVEEMEWIKELLPPSFIK